MDDVQLSKLPASDAQQETEDVGLLLLLELFDIFEGTHLFLVSVSLGTTTEQLCDAFGERNVIGRSCSEWGTIP